MRRIERAEITFISLVPRGANKMPVIYKADNTFEITPLTKFDEEQGELLNVVYVPEHRDTQKDIASALVIKNMAYDAARRGLSIDIGHDGKALSSDQAFIAEHFLIAKGDERFQGWTDQDGASVDLTDAWATVMKIDDPEIRLRCKSGELGGVSMFGRAIVTAEKAEDETPSWFTKFLKAVGLGQPTPNEEIPVEKQELIDILKEQNEALIAALKPSTPVTKSDETPQDQKVGVGTIAIKFEGDPSKAKDVQAHLDAVRLSQIDFNDPKQVEAHLSSLTKEDAPEATPEQSEELVLAKSKVESLEAKIAKKEGESGQPDPADAPVTNSTMEKTEALEYANGIRIAKMFNAS